jgi:hypothetical protein
VNIPFQIPLLNENASGQLPHIYDIDDSMTIVFLSLDIPSLIQPMDQGSITILRDAG